jgi:hypothetical protein
MIIGADVTHPAPGEIRPSVVAVVASMDEFAFKYSGRLKVQNSGTEVYFLDSVIMFGVHVKGVNENSMTDQSLIRHVLDMLCFT